MSTKDFSWLINNGKKFLPCQKNKVFLSNVYNPRSQVNTANTWAVKVVNSSSATVFRTRFTVDMISEVEDLVLYEGTRFEFDGREYYLAQYLELKAGIPVLDVKFETLETTIVQDGDLLELKYIYPFLSCNSVTQQNDSNVAEDNVFSGGFGMEKAIMDISDSYELSGAKVINDVGYNILAEARNTGNVVDVQFIDSFMIGVEEFSAICIGIDRTIDRGDFFQIKVSLGKLL